MIFLPNLKPVGNEVGAEKFNKVEKTLGDKVRKIVKFFCVIFGWLILNVIFTLFISRSRSLTLDAYRLMSESFHQFFAQDFSLFWAIVFEKNKLYYILTLAVLFVFGFAIVVLLLNNNSFGVTVDKVTSFKSCPQSAVQTDAFVVAYKQHVAFLA